MPAGGLKELQRRKLQEAGEKEESASTAGGGTESTPEQQQPGQLQHVSPSIFHLPGQQVPVAARSLCQVVMSCTFLSQAKQSCEQNLYVILSSVLCAILPL